MNYAADEAKLQYRAELAKYLDEKSEDTCLMEECKSVAEACDCTTFESMLVKSLRKSDEEKAEGCVKYLRHFANKVPPSMVLPQLYNAALELAPKPSAP